MTKSMYDVVHVWWPHHVSMYNYNHIIQLIKGIVLRVLSLKS